jgi:MoaA/NifB/PqqE/SkfB family radical SAM enzyme
MCAIWRIKQTRQIETADLIPHLESFRKLGTRWIALSGGAALLHDNLRGLLELLRGEGMRITLLSTGLLLVDNAALVTELVDDVIVSLDGPHETHNAIRRVRDAYERMAEGISALRALRSDMPISARSTVQKNNFRELPKTVDAARELGLNSISFLAVDATSKAFNREDVWDEDEQARVMLTADAIVELSKLLDGMSVDYAEDFRSGFIQESPEKMRRIVRHFRSALGEIEAAAPKCKCAVGFRSGGEQRNSAALFLSCGDWEYPRAAAREIVNSESALRFRACLDMEKNAICRRCVCSLYYS